MWLAKNAREKHRRAHHSPGIWDPRQGGAVQLRGCPGLHSPGQLGVQSKTLYLGTEGRQIAHVYSPIATPLHQEPRM